jgi:hypothetical protein
MPFCAPRAFGVNVTVTVQDWPAGSEYAKVDWQVFVATANSELLEIMLAMMSEAVPVFESVTVCGPPVTVMTWLPKASVDGETEATGWAGGGAPLY